MIPEQDQDQELDLECVICCYQFSRSDRIPRVLHCRHTFCASCLERMSWRDGIMSKMRCPLCRWITCTRASLSPSGALLVNTSIWDLIVDAKMDTSAEELNYQKIQLIQPTL